MVFLCVTAQMLQVFVHDVHMLLCNLSTLMLCASHPLIAFSFREFPRDKCMQRTGFESCMEL